VDEILINLPKNILTLGGIKYIGSRLFQAFLKDQVHPALRSAFSKEFLNEGWTLGVAGNGGASHDWKG